MKLHVVFIIVSDHVEAIVDACDDLKKHILAVEELVADIKFGCNVVQLVFVSLCLCGVAAIAKYFIHRPCVLCHVAALPRP